MYKRLRSLFRGNTLRTDVEPELIAHELGVIALHAVDQVGNGQQYHKLGLHVDEAISMPL
jgi:hypothetical protein|tara:strand:- start:724 stop:903 length:180 start_codon:yes stop_codon:yes gene_type:complete